MAKRSDAQASNEQSASQAPDQSANPSLSERVQSIAPGLSLSRILNEVGEELSHQAKLGAHELAAGLFRHGYDAYVMYPRREGVEQGVEPPEQQKQNDGIEM